LLLLCSQLREEGDRQQNDQEGSKHMPLRIASRS
jgi:hypothetical protein